MDSIKSKLEIVESEIKNIDIPTWETLPGIELYMDQVIELLNRYISIIKNEDGESEKITKSMINNYVKSKVVPAPVKKRYSKTHMAYLIIVCFMKQVFSISVIKKIMPDFEDEEGIIKMYNSFIGYIKGVSSEDVQKYFAHCQSGDDCIIKLSTESIMLKIVTQWLI